MHNASVTFLGLKNASCLSFSNSGSILDTQPRTYLAAEWPQRGPMGSTSRQAESLGLLQNKSGEQEPQEFRAVWLHHADSLTPDTANGEVMVEQDLHTLSISLSPKV